MLQMFSSSTRFLMCSNGVKVYFVGLWGARCGRITACRVVVKAASGHHRTSGLYEIHVHLTLPDSREVNVSRTPPLDERYSDLTFAINDVFKHARRQLQDHVRRMQGHVKQHGSQKG